MECADEHDGEGPPEDLRPWVALDDERAQVSEGLRHLFPAAPYPLEEGGADEDAQSPYFETFLETVALRSAPLATGFSSVDGLLDGGLRPGLWLLAGTSAGLATSFLDALVWAAVDTGRPVLFDSLRTGAQAAWERLLCEFGRRMEDPIRLADLRPPLVSPAEIEHVRRLDTGMVRHLFPLLSLGESLPGESRSLLGFLSRLEAQLEEAERPPVVLVDGLSHLAVLIGLSTGRSVALLSEVDGLLRRHGAVGVLSVGSTLDETLTATASGILSLEGSQPAAEGDEGSATTAVVVRLLASRWDSQSGEAEITLPLGLP